MYRGHKGKYKPINVHKYEGDPTNIIYRSSLERKFMVWCDSNSNILKWSSEEVIIPYKSPKDGRYHKYYPDFKIKHITKSGSIKTTLIEIKPYTQTQKPKIQSRKTRKYITEVLTYGVNISKWEAAREHCIDMGWNFQIITEKDLK